MLEFYKHSLAFLLGLTVIYYIFEVALNRLRAAAQNNLLPPTFLMSYFGVV